MNITSYNTMIFKQEENGKVHYRAGLSTKKQDGNYDNAYIDVRMPKDVNIGNKTKINITKGFLILGGLFSFVGIIHLRIAMMIK